MKRSREKIIPHQDIELEFSREPLLYYLCTPDSHNSDSGIMMVINEFKGGSDSDYFKNELAPFLCEKFNCIVAGVNYFGYQRGRKIEFSEAFINNINRIYALTFNNELINSAKNDKQVYTIIANHLVGKGITALDPRCQPIMKTGKNEYQSWGFLPAIDNLTALGDLLKKYDINKNRIFVYGKNYGGYIAQLMGKFAPNTFSTIIEREGYSKSVLRHIVGGEIMEPDSEIRLNIQGYDHDFTISLASNNPWTIEDENSPYYFSDSHRKIRSLLQEKHKIPSKTNYFVYHTEDNGFSSIENKEKCVELLKKTNTIEFNRAPVYDPYTNLSDIEFLDKFLEEHDLKDLESSNDQTDFDLNSELDFDCGEKDYIFEYSEEGNLSVRIEKKG